MQLSLWDRVRYALSGFKDYKYPATPTLPPKPWHPDGDKALTVVPTRKHPKSDDLIAWMRRDGLNISTGSTKPSRTGNVGGKPINLAKPTDRRFTLTKSVPGNNKLAVLVYFNAPYGASIGYNQKMMVQGNPMQGYSDAKLHIFDHGELDSGPTISEIQNFRHLTDKILLCDGAKQYSLDISSWDAVGASAAGQPVVELTLRYDDVVKDGWIQRSSIGLVRPRHTWVWPATGSDGGVGADPAKNPRAEPDNESAPPMGAVLRLKWSTIEALKAIGYTRESNPQAYAVMDCYAGPGIMIIDTGGTNSTQLEPDNRWDQKDLKILDTLTMDDFEVFIMDENI